MAQGFPETVDLYFTIKQFSGDMSKEKVYDKVLVTYINELSTGLLEQLTVDIPDQVLSNPSEEILKELNNLIWFWLLEQDIDPDAEYDAYQEVKNQALIIF